MIEEKSEEGVILRIGVMGGLGRAALLAKVIRRVSYLPQDRTTKYDRILVPSCGYRQHFKKYEVYVCFFLPALVLTACVHNDSLVKKCFF